ncbi:MAG: extracellular solute-binding protein [Oscillospiraceae bacterium]|nr:extracellular solute-binding protein [Oscillospiraceae bacterium]
MKKGLSLLLALVMMLSLAACTGGSGESGEVANNDPLTKDDVIEVATISHSSWPYRDDWKVWEYISEGCGATVKVNAYPSADVGTKYSLMLASPDTLPDIICYSSKPKDSYIFQGAFVAFEDMEEYMPNYNAWLETLTEDEYKNNVVIRKSYDGKIYYTPTIGREKAQGVRAWLYRKDVFEKNNLAVPTTFDELYNVCKELKAIYPESYPYSIRSGFTALSMSGPSWQPYWEFGLYYDYTDDTWKYGAVEDVMVEMIEFYKKMIDEKLMPADFMTINNAAWQELITSDRGFIFPEYQTRIDFFNGLARVKNPEFDLQAMIPPVAKADTGAPMMNKYNVDLAGMMMCNTRDEKRMANTAKYVDWFYTDEAMELVSWGKEGETFEYVDGKRKYITDETAAQPNTLYGFSTYGVFTRMDPLAVEEYESADIAETRDMVLEHTVPYYNMINTLSFNEEEMAVRDEYLTAVGTYANEMILKMILGQEPISKFDEVKETLNEMGLPELLAVYKSAFDRVK